MTFFDRRLRIYTCKSFFVNSLSLCWFVVYFIHYNLRHQKNLQQRCLNVASYIIKISFNCFLIKTFLYVKSNTVELLFKYLTFLICLVWKSLDSEVSFSSPFKTDPIWIMSF